MFFRKKNNAKKESIPLKDIILLVLMKSYSLKEMISTDADRRTVLEIKEQLSSHPLMKLITELVKNPSAKRWLYEPVFTYGNQINRVRLYDTETEVDFNAVCYSSTGDENHIHVYVNGDANILPKEEQIFLFHLLVALRELETKYKKLEYEQHKLKEFNKLKGLY